MTDSNNRASPASQDRATGLRPQPPAASSQSSVPDAGGFGGRTFRAEGKKLYVNPQRRVHAIGFPFGELHPEAVADDVAPELAEYLSCPKRATAPDLYDALKSLLCCLEVASVLPDAVGKVYVPRFDAPELEYARAILSRACGEVAA